MWYRLVVPCLVSVLALGPLGCVRTGMSGFGWGKSGKNPYRSLSPASLSEHIRTTIKVSAENTKAADQSLVRLHERSPELDKLANLAKADSQDLAARWRLAQAYTAEELYYPAFQLYQEIKSQAPRDPKVDLAIARIWTVWGDYSLARRRTERALELDPDSVEGLGLLGRIHLRRNDPARAKAVFLKALTSKPENPSLLTWLGQAQLMLGNKDEARENWELALQINPTLDLARRLLGRAPAPPAEKEFVAQTPSKPGKAISGAVSTKKKDRPKQWSVKPEVATPTILLPSHAIKKSLPPEPAHPLGLPTALPQPTLPYSLPPALKRFLQESTPSPLESGRSLLIDARAESPRWSHEEIEVATNSRHALLIPVVLVDLEAALASDPPPPIGPTPELLPQLRVELARFLEEPNEPEDSLGSLEHLDGFRWLGLNGLIDFPTDMLGLERNAARTAALFPPLSTLLEEGDIWNLALMILLLSCVAVPAGRRRRSLPSRLRSGRRATLAVEPPSVGEDKKLEVLAHTQEDWDLAGPGCLLPIATFPTLVSEQIGPVAISCETPFDTAIGIEAAPSSLPNRTNEAKAEELGRAVKLAVGALVLTQLAVPLIRRYQRQAPAYPGTRAAC